MARIPLPDPPLADSRVALRQMDDADVPWIVEESRDPLVPRFTSVPEDNTEEDAVSWILAHGPLRERGEELHLLAVDAASGARLGPVGLHHVDWRHRTGEVGYWTARDARGRGLTTAAVRLLCGWALGPLGLERLELRADVDNLASQRVAAKLGFRREGVLRSAQWRPGERRSVVLFGLLAGELT